MQGQEGSRGHCDSPPVGLRQLRGCCGLMEATQSMPSRGRVWHRQGRGVCPTLHRQVQHSPQQLKVGSMLGMGLSPWPRWPNSRAGPAAGPVSACLQTAVGAGHERTSEQSWTRTWTFLRHPPPRGGTWKIGSLVKGEFSADANPQYPRAGMVGAPKTEEFPTPWLNTQGLQDLITACLPHSVHDFP